MADAQKQMQALTEEFQALQTGMLVFHELFSYSGRGCMSMGMQVSSIYSS